MAKFYGAIGFAKMIEDPPESGINKETIVEKNYTGDVLRRSFSYEKGEYLNDDVNISNEISIVADSFALENAYAMRYVTFLKTKWKIRNISVEFPRLVLSIGGVYNDESGPSYVSSKTS